MADGDNLILGTSNNAQSQTDLNVGLGDDNSGSYGLHVQALDGTAVGGRSAVGNGLEGVSFSGSGVAGNSTSDDGVFGISSTGTGAHGTSTSGSGVRGTSFQGTAVEGFSFGAGAAVTGTAPYQTGPGVVGFSQNSFGVRGQSGDANLLPPVGGGPQFQKCAVQGSSDEGTGVRGDSAHKVGVRGRTFTGDAVFGSCADQPNGPKTKGNAIHGMSPHSSPNATAGPFAGKFEGDVTITGNLWVGGRLVWWPWWFSVPIVLAAGLATLDRKGEAIIKLPKGLGALHKDFRYQLTAVGGPARDLHVAREIRADTFKIAGGTSGLKVSWQVAGGLKAGSVAVERAQEKPFDEKAAQAYRGSAKDHLQRVSELKDRSRRRPKR
jgi:hypothetical protein